MDLLACLTPVLVVLVFMCALVVGAVTVGNELSTEFNTIFNVINGEIEK